MTDIAIPDDDSTLVRAARAATTITDMQDYVESIADRPLDKLLTDLPGLAAQSETKFILTRQVVRRRVRDLPEVEREQLRLLANDVANQAHRDVAERVRQIFAID